MFNRRSLLALTLALLTLGCEIEDEIRINPDGSGTYRTKILVKKDLAAAIPEIRKEATEDGFRVIEEGETETRKFIVLERDFKNISEVGDSRNKMSFTATRSGWFRERYEFTASLPGSEGDGFTRQVTIVLPGKIQQSTAGERRGDVVIWNVSKGGSIQITSIGLTASGAKRLTFLAATFGVIVLGLVILLKRKRNVRVPSCAACGVPKQSGARFCAGCGADATPLEVSGG